MAGQSRLNRPQVWDSGSLLESRKSFDFTYSQNSWESIGISTIRAFCTEVKRQF